MTRAGRFGVVAAAVGLAAVLGAGYAAAGPAGLVAAAALATAGLLVVARAAIPRREPRHVRPKDRNGGQTPAVRAADFPAYAKFATDLEWAQMSQRHYEVTLRPTLVRLAVALDRPEPPAAAGPGPGVDLALLERAVAVLEGLTGEDTP